MNNINRLLSSYIFLFIEKKYINYNDSKVSQTKVTIFLKNLKIFGTFGKNTIDL